MPDTTNIISDEELVRLACDGEAHAFEQLMRRHLRGAVAVALEYARDLDDAEDVAQEAFHRTWRALASFDSRQRFRPWFYTIVRNVGRTAAGRRQRRGEVELMDVHATSSHESSDLQRHVHALLDRMTPLQAGCFRLCEIEGFTSEEVGDMLGIAPATVRTHAFRARAHLREALDKLGFREPQ